MDLSSYLIQPTKVVVVIDDVEAPRKPTIVIEAISAGVCMFHPSSVKAGRTWHTTHCVLPLKMASPRAAAVRLKLLCGARALKYCVDPFVMLFMSSKLLSGGRLKGEI